MSALVPADLRLYTDIIMIYYLPAWCYDPVIRD